MDWPIDFRPEILVDNIGSVVKQLTTSMKILVWRELATVTNSMGARDISINSSTFDKDDITLDFPLIFNFLTIA